MYCNLANFEGIIDFCGSFKEYLIRHNMPEKISILKNNLDNESLNIIDECLFKILHYPDADKSRFFYEDKKTFITFFQSKTERLWVYIQNNKLKSYYDRFTLDEHCYNPDVFLFHMGLAFSNKKIHNYIRNKDFIDGGAYNGDSCLVLSYYYSPKKIYSFDISKKNCNRYKEVMKINKIDKSKYELIHFGISKDDGRLYYTDTEEQGTKFDSSGSDVVNTTSIDNFALKNNLHTGFIKLDLEGYALDALLGMKETIRKDRPVLSIAIYHSPTEFFEVKPLLESIVNDLNYTIKIISCHPFSGVLREINVFAYPKELEDNNQNIKLFQKAYEKKLENLDESIALTQKYLNYEPENLLALEHLAECYYDTYDATNLEKLGNYILMNFPNNNYNGYVWLAQSAEIKHDILTAINYMYTAIRISSKKSIYTKLIDLLRLTKKFKEAKKQAKCFIDDFKNFGEGFIQLAYMENDPCKKLYYIQQSIQVEPTQMFYHMYLGEYYRKMNMWDDAKKVALDMLKYFPFSGEGYAQLAHLESAKGNNDSAIEYAHMALQTEPLYAPQFIEVLVHLLLTKNEFEKSEQFVREGIEIHHGWVEGYHLLSIIHEKSNKNKQAQDDLRCALQIYPYSFYVREKLANMLRFQGDLKESELLVQKGLTLNPYWGEGYAQLSHLSSARHDRKKALEFAEKACSIDPYSPSLKKHFSNLYHIWNNHE